MRKNRARALGLAIGAVAFGGIGVAALGSTTASANPRLGHQGFPGFHAPGMVYMTTNSVTGSSVDAFASQPGGSLVLVGTFPTGGIGTGGSGFSQGAVALSADGSTLLTVDAGSNQVSDFAVNQDGRLQLRDVVASGGIKPISVAIVGGLVEVLNSGGTPNVTGFVATDAGLTPIAGGSQPLSSAANTPEDVVISPDGSHVVVTEKVSNTIDTFAVGAGGTLSPAVTSPSDTPLSFAAVFTQTSQLLVADDGAAGTSALSSYRIASNGTVSDTQPSLPDAQTAACWVAIAPRNGLFGDTAGIGTNVFVDNAGSGTMASYEVLPDGRLAFFGNTSAGVGAKPLDNAVSSDGRYLYVLDGNLNQISVFSIGADAQLSPVGATPIPAGSAGIAAS